MKLTKMAGAFALTAAMAMATVPAFAATTAENVEQFTSTDSSNATASTDVKFEVVDASLNATIPTKVAVVIPSTGGTITGPTNYEIVNNSTGPIRVSKLQVSAPNANMSIPASSWTTDPAAPSAGGIILGTLSIGGGSPLQLHAATNGVSVQTSYASALIANGAKCSLELGGKVLAPTGGLTASDLTSTAMKIQYTITNQI